MSRDDLHQYATTTTPSEVHVPNSWPALAVWAVGKFGIGIVFLAMLVYVYADLREANKAMLAITSANVDAIKSLASEIEGSAHDNAEIRARLESISDKLDRREP